MSIHSEYNLKLRTPEQAAQLVKNGDWIDFASAAGFPTLCDAAIAQRKDELFDIKIRGILINGPIMTVESDPYREHFTYNSWFCSGYERKLVDRGLCFHHPMLLRNFAWYYHNLLTVNIAFMCATPMDEEGYFNLSIIAGTARAVAEKAEIVVIEVNETLPKIHGSGYERIHISEVDYIVEGPHTPVYMPASDPTDTDRRIAENLLPYIVDGSTIQLGIGGVPTALGMMIAESDICDLGMHTEFLGDAFLKLYEAGKLTNNKKTIDKGLGVFGFALGSQKLYDWIDDNHNLASFEIGYVNDPYVLGRLDNFVSINGCLSVDLYGQISAESAKLRHISGTGGQVDFVTGAALSKGGKSFICLNSYYFDKAGKKKSRIVPHFEGEIITTPRSHTFYVATEYGAVNLMGKSTWERAELLISIADPEFRDELIAAAEMQKIWRQSNKR